MSLEENADWIELIFHQRFFNPTCAYGNVVEATRPEALPEVTHPGNHYLNNRQADVRPRLVQHQHFHSEPLGNTEFCDQRAAYDELPPDLRKKLEGKTVLHDFNKFWEMMRREKGSARPALTEAQRKAKPPVSHPIFLPHPITGRKALYANPGYSVRINELPQKESDAILEFLFEHQTQPRFRFAARWQVGDVLMWDNLRTIHNAVADYSADEPRLIKRCQVMATRFFQERS